MQGNKEIPQATAERYLITLKELVSIARKAIAATQDEQQSALWQRKVLLLLEGQFSAAQQAQAHYAIGNQKPLVDRARRSLSLARDMDGYSLNFAGETFAAQFVEQRRLVVFAAWQVCESAGAI
jgi:hypothetical protein